MKKQKLFILCAILGAGILCGCTNSKFIIDKHADNYSQVQKYSERDHFFSGEWAASTSMIFPKFVQTAKLLR